MRALPGCAHGGGGSDGEGPVIQCMKWGLVPSFTGKAEKPDYFRMFNARSESVKEKVSFRRLIQKNRCLVAVEGYVIMVDFEFCDFYLCHARSSVLCV
ncbi:hypothetical protein ZEAMMB73_Zm00001d004644 [Zea mays]|nr:hypothetical protein ZEAMMB73_Zm00001d004644 [Zea mays]